MAKDFVTKLIEHAIGSGSARGPKDSSKNIRQAQHDARNDAARSGHLPERQRNKVRDSPEGRKIWDAAERNARRKGRY